MSTGLEQLEELAERLAELGKLPSRAGASALSEVLQVARAQEAAGESPDGAGWDPLREGSGAPLRELVSGIDGAATSAGFKITTPEELKFHQGGYPIHTGAAGERLREAQASAKTAKTNADADGLKRARRLVREFKKIVRAEASRVVARRTLPGRRSMPILWGQAIERGVNTTVEAILGRVA